MNGFPVEAFLWMENLDPLFYVALALALFPWLILLKMKGNIRNLLKLEDSAAMVERGRRSCGAPGASPQAGQEASLLELLQEERARRTEDANGKSERWDLELIIPAYNEELNIESCVQSFADSALNLYDEHGLRTRLIVVDDRSTDRTHALVEACQDRLGKLWAERSGGWPEGDAAPPVALTLLKSEERPAHEIWFGKNWACHTGFLASESGHLFFVDADVSVKKRFLSAFVNRLDGAYRFVGLVSTLVCKTPIDFIVQPNLAMSTFIANNLSTALEAGSRKPHAFGQCIFISRQAYLATGGYRTANEDSLETRGLETRALARNIVRAGIRAVNVAGGDLIQVYMYHDARSLWEGLTKSFFMAVDKSVFNAAFSVALILLLFDLPLLFLLFSNTVMLLPLYIAGHLALRAYTAHVYKITFKGWFLFPLSGLALTAIMIGSAYKVLSGQNWTWKGRSLALSAESRG